MLAQKEMEGLDKLRLGAFLRFVPLPTGAGPWFDPEQTPIISEEFAESSALRYGSFRVLRSL